MRYDVDDVSEGALLSYGTRATLDWLNEITNDKFNFFGVEVELFQIGESPVAPHFKVISKPNDWSKTVSDAAKRIEAGDLTPTRQLQLRLWTKLREYAENRGTFLKFQKAERFHRKRIR